MQSGYVRKNLSASEFPADPRLNYRVPDSADARAFLIGPESTITGEDGPAPAPAPEPPPATKSKPTDGPPRREVLLDDPTGDDIAGDAIPS